MLGLLSRSVGTARREQRDFVGYADALDALGLNEPQLRELVAQGRLRGFRDEASLKFLRADIDALARRKPRRA